MSQLSRSLEAGVDNDFKDQPKKWKDSTKQCFIYLFLCLITFLIATSLIYDYLPQTFLPFDHFHGPPKASLQCFDPPTRREWRSLGESEKTGYLRAVKRLKSKSSRVRKEGTLYDDFPFVHNLIGGYCKCAGRFY